MDSFDDLQGFNQAPPPQFHPQPKTHQRNKSCYECLACCQSTETDLSQPQLALFYSLKTFSNELYDENNPSHQAKLQDLYYLYFNRSLADGNLLSEDWISLGFQSKNAQTDFRGAGLLGLENIRLFILNQRKLVEQMADPSQEFLFSMTSLNISFHLKVFFHLADYLTYEKDKKVICSREALKNFGRMLENNYKPTSKKMQPHSSDNNNKNDNNKPTLVLQTSLESAKVTIYEIHEVLLLFCFKKWTHIKKIRKETPFMDFYKVFEEMKRVLAQIFNIEETNSIQQLRNVFQKLVLKGNV